MVDFSKVIVVRERKMGAAKKSQIAAHAACEDARKRLAVAKDDVEDFSEWVQQLEVNLLSDLMKTRITVHDVAIIRDKLNKAQEKARQLIDQVEQEKLNLQMQEELLEAERQKAIRLQSKLKRITELDKKLTEIDSKNRMKAEDAKMDEFAEIMSARGKS